jgi:hypothetical protein
MIKIVKLMQIIVIGCHLSMYIHLKTESMVSSSAAEISLRLKLETKMSIDGSIKKI